MRLLRPYVDLDRDEFPLPPMTQKRVSTQASVAAWIIVVLGAAAMALLIGWGSR